MGKGRIRYMNCAIKIACQAVLSLITAHAGECTKSVALIMQLASMVRRMGRRRAAFPGESGEHPKTDQ